MVLGRSRGECRIRKIDIIKKFVILRLAQPDKNHLIEPFLSVGLQPLPFFPRVPEKTGEYPLQREIRC